MIRYGLIGWPVGHSFSARYFNNRFMSEGIEARYDLYPFEHIEGLAGLIEDTPGLRGLNVTAPHKRDVIPLLDSLTPEARAVGAVNTIRIEPTDSPTERGRCYRLHGHNTDIGGFACSVAAMLRPDTCRALVLGTGGAASAVCHALASLNVLSTLVSRNPGTFASLAAADIDIVSYADLDEAMMTDNRLIVNATPLGTWPDVDLCPPIPYHFVTELHVCHDLVYNPAETRFMALCRSRGAEVANGLAMLHAQADLAYRFWNCPPC